MGKTVVLDGAELEWARQRFRTYYGVAVLEPPAALARREFALFPFARESTMRRHTAFPATSEFQGYVRHEAPRHVYYSSAYYERPDHPKMAEKGWLGADLLFDLDADHLRQAPGLSYAAQLELVRGKVRDLWDDFLVRDFGLGPGDLQLVFSGGRGYHVHVQHEAYVALGAPERREIVDYVTGTGVDARRVLVSRRAGGSGGAVELEGADAEPPASSGRRRDLRPFLRLPAPTAPGWAGRISRSFRATLERWERDGVEVAVRELLEAGAQPSAAKPLANLLVKRGRARLILGSVDRDGTSSLEAFPGDVPGILLDVVLRQAAIEVQGETDAPVTTDLHRLIRLPGSLHGGTGFKVLRLTRERLDTFDPFRDAPAYVGPGRTEVRLTEPVDHPFPEPVQGAPGELRTLPDPVALFLVLRGEATLPPGPAR